MATTDGGERRKFLAKNQPPAIELNKTICIEWFRLFAFVAITIMTIGGTILSEKYVFFPMEDESMGERALRAFRSLRGASEASEGTGRHLESVIMFGQEHPYVDRTQTAIWKLFGMPHACSYIDYHPAKEMASIMLPLFSFPMTIFLILAHYRNQLVYVNAPDDKEAKSLYWFSKYSTYFTVTALQMTHLWFVNAPDAAYPDGFGFVGHYIPYATFQTALAFMAIMQVKYDIITGNIPFGVSANVARSYVVFIFGLTAVYQIFTIALLVGTPIMDPNKGGLDMLVFSMIFKLYTIASLVIPTACSVWTIFYSGDTNTFKMALQ